MAHVKQSKKDMPLSSALAVQTKAAVSARGQNGEIGGPDQSGGAGESSEI